MTQLARTSSLEPTQRPIGLGSLEPARGESSSQLPTLNHQPSTALRISLLTGGDDKPYVLGLTESLTSSGILLDLIGSDELNVPELLGNPRINFLNLRGDQRPEATLKSKALRIFRYYLSLIYYAATAQPKVFHILWNNKFELFDRTILLLYYKICRKRITFTAHNVNMAKRNGNDSWLNRVSLKIQYHLSDHIFVHTAKMKLELVSDFGVTDAKISVIPFGINNTLPNTELTAAEARKQLGIRSSDKTVLFFGQIATYKGVEYLIEAFGELAAKSKDYRLIIAGKPKSGYERYWEQIRSRIARKALAGRVIQRIEHIPDEEAEVYFKAADALILPYTAIFQSGLLFLGYAFGLPVIAADVGSLKEEIIEGETGFAFKARDSSDLASKIDKYFKSELFQDLETRRAQIKTYANDRYSWHKVAATTMAVYSHLLRNTEDRCQIAGKRG